MSHANVKLLGQVRSFHWHLSSRYIISTPVTLRAPRRPKFHKFPQAPTAFNLPNRHSIPRRSLESDNANFTTRSAMSSAGRDAAENESPLPAALAPREEEAVDTISSEENQSDSSGSGGVVMVHGDIFAAPTNSVLIHACNCQGSWGAGIALAFKQLYPAAYRIYHNHCTNLTNPSSLLGTALLIPPQPTDRNNHWIACLFTSVYYGRRVDDPDKILESTASAFEHFLNLVANEEVAGRRVVGELHACKINSGRFGVDWERSRRVLEEGLEVGGRGRVVFAYEFEEGEGVEGLVGGEEGGEEGEGAAEVEVLIWVVLDTGLAI
ncbi:ADP-ribose 1''-phosphate phosphatase [Arthrobotrys conoides]|uniref:ADP-ribose 1''-phosphate phosphatase n=1 Tax=Arthrobotrys conoides TaxID=74498 RepID=A0AAN8S0K8_9PEZI